MEILGAIMAACIWLSLSAIIGIKPRRPRGVFLWSAVAAVCMFLPAMLYDLMRGGAESLLAALFTLLILVGLWWLPATAIRLVVRAIGRNQPSAAIDQT